MAYYRLYFFNGANRIEQFREFELTDDFAAIRQAAEWRGTAPMELWSGARKVRRWDQFLAERVTEQKGGSEHSFVSQDFAR